MNRALQPLHTREFNIDAAKAGAPYALACGWPVEIFKWDGKNAGGPIMGVFGVDDRISTWRANGEFSIQDNPRLALVMIPLGYLDGKPVFVGDEILNFARCVTRAFVGMDFCEGSGWRWPAPPKAYPMTGMAYGELREVFNEHNDWIVPARLDNVATAALRHYIDNLTVLPDDCALRAKLVEMGWTPPDTSANWLERVTPANAKEGAR